MAGGQGTKLWPFSTEKKPKQFQPIFKDKTLFQYNVEILTKQYEPKDIFISTKKSYVHFCKDQAPQIPDQNYIIEPDAKKDRGPAEGFVFTHMVVKHPDEPTMLVQSDCMRAPEDAYLTMLRAIEKLAGRDKKFITGGIKATYPILGVDYLRLGKKVSLETDLEVYSVDEFVFRSDDYYKTKSLIENFYITTHCNHTCWYPKLMLEAYQKHRPDWYESLMQIKEVIGTEHEEQKIDEIYAQMAKGATEEVTKHVFAAGYVVLMPYRWTDFGTWESVYQYFSHEGAVYSEGLHIALESEKTLLKSSDPKKLIAVIGLKGFAVVDTPNVLFIAPFDKTDKLKDLQAKIKETNLTDYL